MSQILNICLRFSLIIWFQSINFDLLSAQMATEIEEKLCRTETGIRLPYDWYALDTCARCYNYMPATSFKVNMKFMYDFGTLIDTANNVSYFSNETLHIARTFISPSMIIKWQQCCTDAIHCCIQSLQYFNEVENKQLCPRTWDGWSCWQQEADPGQLMKQSCPKHIYWHQIVPPCRGFTTKQCNSSGYWFSQDNGREWTNYSMCARDDIFVGRIRYSIVTNVISMCTLIPALLIFSHYKQLSSVSRIRLHKHLFTSLFIYALISSLLKWYLLKTSQSGRSTDVWLSSICLLLSILSRYFRSTTYLWMFNEALYLHQLIKQAFTQPSLTPLIAMAYTLPAITTLVYIVIRAVTDGLTFSSNTQIINTLELRNSTQNSFISSHNSHYQTNDIYFNNNQSIDPYFENLMKVIDNHEDANPIFEEDKCWLMPSPNAWMEWIINAPNLAILIVNCFFLFKLIRVLCKKASSSSTMTLQYSANVSNTGGVITRQSVIVSLRAALLLLPLYGLHYLFVVYRPHIENCWTSEVYHYFSLTLDGLQGCAVSIIFCFANNEIRYLLTRSLERVSTRQRSTTIYMTEVVATQQH